MFNLLKRSKMCELYAPVTGKMIPIETVPDQVFAKKMMGDGIAFQFDSDTLYAPCRGEIIMAASTGHAIGIKTENQAEILIHVGMDTVNLNGEGFQLLVHTGSKVKLHDPILKINIEFMKEKGMDLTTPLIITNGTLFQTEKFMADTVNINTKVMQLTRT